MSDLIYLSAAAMVITAFKIIYYYYYYCFSRMPENHTQTKLYFQASYIYLEILVHSPFVLEKVKNGIIFQEFQAPFCPLSRQRAFSK